MKTIILITALALTACVERAPDLSPADRERLREYVSETAPTPEHPLEVQFENGIQLLGYDTDPDQAVPGQELTITWHWHAGEDIDDGWNMFTHVAKANGENALNQDGVGVIREIYPPGRWQPGEYIKDVQRVMLPADWGSDRAVFYLGFWNESHRLAVLRGPNDGENRVRAASIEVGAGAAAAAAPEQPAQPAPPPVPPTPVAIAAQTTEPIEIDGELTEAVWGRAGRVARFANTLNGQPAELEASARFLWDDTNLYVAFEVNDNFVSNTITDRRDGHLWEQDAVEIMIDPDGDGRNYFEMQVSPTGRVFDTRYDSRRQPEPFGDLAWTSRLRSEVKVRGTANDDQPDEGYTVEVAVPWAAFAAGEPPAQPPTAGQSWRVNLYVMDKRPEGPQHSAGWSATLEGDFHVPARFGTVRFMGAPPTAAVALPPGVVQPGAQPGAPTIRPGLQLNPEAMQALRRRLAADPAAPQRTIVQPRAAIRPPPPTP